MRKNFLVATVLCACTMLNAQNGESKKGPYETNRFYDNWFLSIGGGASIYEGEEDNKGGLAKRIAPAYDLSIGKWVTPSVGLRLQYAGGQAKGFSSFESPFSKSGSVKNGYYKEQFNVNSLHADLMWNLTNVIGGYNPERIWNVVPFVGFGVMRTSKSGISNNEYAAVGGIVNTFRVSKRIDINLEARQFLMRDNQNEVVYGSVYEGMTSITAGIGIKLGKTDFNKGGRISTLTCNSNNDKINDLRSELEAKTNETNSLKQELNEVRNKKPETIVKTETIASATPVALFFTIGQSVLDEKELLNLEFFVDNALKIDKNKHFTLIGSADKETGTPVFNEELTRKRVDYVYNLLVKKYGISPSRLTKEAQGSSANRFKKPELNRVVIIE